MNTDESLRLKLNIVLISKISVSEKFYTHDHEMILQFLKVLKLSFLYVYVGKDKEGFEYRFNI